MVWVESVSACKTSLGQMISVQFCHKSLNAWLGEKAVGRLCFNISSHWLTSRILKEEKMGVISKSRFFLKNALMIHRNVKSKSILAAGKVVHFEWKDKCVQKLGRNKQRTWSRNMKSVIDGSVKFVLTDLFTSSTYTRTLLQNLLTAYQSAAF